MAKAKSKKFVKDNTVQRIKTLLKKYRTKEAVLSSDEYDSLYNYYMNIYEKEHVDMIIDACIENKSYDEIRFLIQGGNDMSKKENTKIPMVETEEIEDPVAAEAIFFISQQKVKETDGPVDVIIGEFEEVKKKKKDKHQTEAENKSVDDDEIEVEEFDPGEVLENAICDSFDRYLANLRKSIKVADEATEEFDHEIEAHDRLIEEKVKQMRAENKASDEDEKKKSA